MIKENLSLDSAIEYLNRLVAADAEAVRKLIDNRVECNDVLAEDPTCQVSGFDGTNKVGLLGVLNGAFGIHEDGWGAICAIVSDDEKILYGFRRTKIVGFDVPLRKDIPEFVNK